MSRLRPLQRRIESAYIKGHVGLITAEHLLAVADTYWLEWRQKLTDGWRGDPEGYVGHCGYCSGRVYIYLPNGRPAFSHFEGQGNGCPWHHKRNLTEDEQRKLQYHGNQASQLHEQLCADLHRFVSADPRCIDSKCNQRLNAAEGDKYKIPDVSASIEGFGKVAMELQLSKTFQTEISDRQLFYNGERTGLLWVFYGELFEWSNLAVTFKDVIHRQRGNAFVLDLEARKASEEQRTLVLKCYLRNDAGFEAGRLVRLDELTIPAKGCMYLEDRITPQVLRDCEQERLKWEEMLKDRNSPYAPFTHAELKELDLRDAESWKVEQGIKFVATVLSIVAAAKGQPKQYACQVPNIKAMLNTYLDPNKGYALACHARLLESLLAGTACKGLLKDTVGKLIERAKASYGKPPNHHQGLSVDSTEGKLLKRLVPEVFDGEKRALLLSLGTLPTWAQ